MEAPSDQCEPLDRLDKIAVREHVRCIVVTMSEQRGDLPMEQLLACRFKGVRIENGVGFYERLTKKIPLEGLKPSYFVFQGGFRWPSDTALYTPLGRVSAASIAAAASSR